MRKPLAACILQLYALALAAIATLGGVRTDEAKYLLNIPYPHPPLARSILETTYGLPWNEALWRVVFATLVVQSVWLVVRMLDADRVGARTLLGAAWLLSGAVLLQAPTIMMAPLTALCGLLFVVAGTRRLSASECFLVAVAWFASLFIAYQSALFLPVVLGALLRSGMPKRRVALYVFGPLAALALYTLTNPLALQSMIALGGDRLPFAEKVWRFVPLWLLAGSGVVSILGTIGVVLSRRWDWIGTFLLVCAYITLSYHTYYGIFLVPLFVAGLAWLLRNTTRFDTSAPTIAVLSVAGCVLGAGYLFTQVDHANPARDTMRVLLPEIRAIDKTDMRMIIVGDFGHEWQYYTPAVVPELLKYAPEMASPDADVIVCWTTCDPALLNGKQAVVNAPIESWIRRDVTLHM